MRYSGVGYWGRQIGGVAFAVATLAVVIWLVPPRLHLVGYAIAAITSFVAVVVALSAYAKADEVILETHKSSWFWGSFGSMALIPALMIAIFEGVLPIPTLVPVPNPRPVDWFVDGVLALLALQSIGYLLVWAYHNIRRRL